MLQDPHSASVGDDVIGVAREHDDDSTMAVPVDDAPGGPIDTDPARSTLGAEDCSKIYPPALGAACTSGPWSNKVRAHPPSLIFHHTFESAARRSHMLAGVWNPIHQKQLIKTLMVDWEAPVSTAWSPDVAAMR